MYYGHLIFYVCLANLNKVTDCVTDSESLSHSVHALMCHVNTSRIVM